MGNQRSVQDLEQERAALRAEYRSTQDVKTMERISNRFTEIDRLLNELKPTEKDSPSTSSLTDLDATQPSAETLPETVEDSATDSRKPRRDAIAEFEALLSKPSPVIAKALDSLDREKPDSENGNVEAVESATPTQSSGAAGKSPMDLLEEMLADSPPTFEPVVRAPKENQDVAKDEAPAHVEELRQAFGVPKQEALAPETTSDEGDGPESEIPVAVVTCDEPVLNEPPSDEVQIEEPVDEPVTEGLDSPIGGLNNMPTPAFEPALKPQIDAMDFIRDEESKFDDEPENPDPHEIIEEAKRPINDTLAAIRAAVINLETPTSDPDPVDNKTTPIALKECVADSIPPSVSEELPKFESESDIRSCSSCGQATQLSDIKCRKCGMADPSLGVLDYVIAGDLRKVTQILTARPDVIATKTSTHGWTLLHMSASGGNPRMTELLLEHGADINAQNAQGKTALHYAAGKGHEIVVTVLIENEADTTLRYNNKTPIELAQRAGHINIVSRLEKSAI